MPRDSIASNDPISTFSIASYSNLPTKERVNSKIATVPAVRPSPNINVAINADTRVGKVRTKLSRNLKKLTTTLFLVMLEDDKTAAGSANKAPMRDPRKLIFKVSINGFQILGI